MADVVNVTHVVKGTKLIITVDISPAACEAAEPSMSGKTMIVASTKGSEKVQGPPGWDLSYSINVMGKQKQQR